MNYESVQEMFSRTASESGSHVAIDRAGQRVTYTELEAESNRLANFLLAGGVGRGSMVALFTDDPIRIITGILAVLKAGGVFVPLDPTFPDERLRIMREQVEPGWYVTESKHLEKLSRLCRGTSVLPKVICLDESEEFEDYGGYARCEPPDVASDPDAPCSIYFTSGSTGKPKAILGRLKGIDHFMRWEIEAVGAQAGTRVSQLASPSFDGFLKDAFVPLCSGGVVCAPKSRDIVLDAWRLADWLDVEQVEVLHCVPSVFRALINCGLQSKYFTAMKCVVMTGEPLYPADVKRWMEVFGERVKLLNIYGTTETSLSKFYHVIQPADLERPSIPVGKPIDGAAALLVNPRGELCAPWAVGEIYIQTPYRSFGYYGEPELTRQVFVQNPFNNDPEDIVHKTGDYGRWLKGGELEHLGRRDQQVQVRGVRVELGEIENLLRSHEAVADVAVIDRDDAQGNKFLVAYVTLNNGAGSEQLRTFLAERLPGTMMPSAFVKLDQLPRTLNGKIDRKSLPTLEQAPAEGDPSELIPRTPVEDIVAGVWCEVLRLPAVARTANFFEVGGHSLLATQVVIRLKDTLKVELTVRHMFELPTVAQLSQLIQEKMIADGPGDTAPIEPVSREGALPLSFSQQRLWFIDQLGPGSSAYNTPLRVRLKGSLNQAAFEQAFYEIVRRHENLRTSFPSSNGKPLQVIHGPRQIAIPAVDLSGLKPVQHEAAATHLAGVELARPFDLATGPLTRITLLKQTEEEHTVLCTLHHIISDGWSKGLLVHEISVLYEAYCQGKPSPLEELPIQYADFASWQREWLTGDALDRELAYWKDNLAGAPLLLELPLDRPRPPVQTFNGAAETFTLSGDLTKKLKALSHQQGVTLFMTLLGAFQVLLHRYTSQNDFVIGTSVANRDRSEVEGLIGFFVNMLALRADCSDNPPFDLFLKQVRETSLKAYAHQRLPFERLVEELQPERNLSYSPLFQVICSFQNQPTLRDLTLSGLTLSFPTAEVTTSPFDLLLDMSEGAGGLQGGLQYNPDLFERSTIARMLEHYCNLLEGIAANPELRLSELPLLSENEEFETLVEWNETRSEYPDRSCIHELFESRVKTAPDAIAAVFKDDHLSYAELNRKANQVARYLLATGVTPGDLVGICLDHSLEELAALLGVLKAGAGYVPLEPGYPLQRLSTVLADSGVLAVLTQQSFANALVVGGAQPICIDTEWDYIAKEDASNLATELPVENVAYVIYTSGSTGEPKGVAISHRALVNYVWWAKEAYLQGEELNFALYSSLAFDLTATSIFVSLVSGNQIFVYGPEGNRPALLDIVLENRVEILKLTPSHLSLIHEEDHRQSRIKRMIVGGEALRTSVAREVQANFEAEIYNEYGPTEATVGCMIYKFDPSVDKRAFVPIGRPAANTQIYVLDQGLSPVVENMIGEIYIAGAGLADGYWNRSRLTAERFLPDPFTTNGRGMRMYRTGDLARRLPGGALEFLGRNDEQVKIRGYRVEPGEIEAALRKQAGVSDAVVIAKADHLGETTLVGYVVPAPGQHIDSQTIRQELAQSLPGYMAPAAIVTLDALPLSSNGKLDRHALPLPEFTSAVFRPARTPQEEILCSLFAEVTGVPQVGLDDNFFELGGHSLLGTRLISLVRATLGCELPLRTLFEAPTVVQLSSHLREAMYETARRRLPLQPQARPASLPLSYAQQRLWFLDQLEGATPEYNMPLALRLRGPLLPSALEQAVNLIVARHESLRTHFGELDGQPVQIIAPTLRIELPLEDLAELDEAAQQTRVRGCLAREAEQFFDLKSGPMLRVKLFKLSAEEHILLRTTHHIVSDGWSEEVFLRELVLFYEAVQNGSTNPLPPLTIQYADFALWQRQWLEADVLTSGVAYWKQQLAGIPERLELPTDRPRPAQQTFTADVYRTSLSKEQTTALKQLSRSQQATLYMTLLAVFGLLLQRYSGQDDVVVGSPIANRQEAQLEDLIGFFVNMLCLRVCVKGTQTFAELLAEVRQTALAAYEHQDVPFERLVEELSPQRSLNNTPVFQVAFALQNAPQATTGVEGLEVTALRSDELRVRYDLEVHVADEDGELGLTWLYNRDLFDGWRVEQMGAHYLRLLETVIGDPEQLVGEIELLDTEERYRILEQWNDTAVNVAPSTLPGLFVAQAAKTPDAIALVFEEQTLTYAELNARANQLAHFLIEQGAGAGVCVGLLLHRSPQIVVSMLAILKAGGTYLPLDPVHPPDRTSLIIEDAAAPVVICQQPLADRLLGQAATVVNLDSHAESIAQQPDTNPPIRSKQEDLSHVIYTSGSTGQPKGVAIRHDSVVNLLRWAHQTFTAEELSGVLASTSICFDLSVFEIFAPLTCGGAVILARDALHLATHADAERVTLINTVPSAMAELLRMKAVGASVRTINLAGEALKRDLVQQVYAETSVGRVLNLYGPTEYTTYTTGKELERDSERQPTIGRPIANTQVYIVDEEIRPVPQGVTGEICIGGRGLAEEYLSRPALTAERFMPDRFSGEAGARLFRTGDLGQYLQNGEIDYLGRKDHQVKIRGYRIEPGEIEAALRKQAGVSEAVVVAKADHHGETALVGYVVPARDQHLEPQALRQQLAQSLPGYMVPAAIVTLDALPLTVNGKLDRAALPLPEFTSAVFRPPSTPQEEILCSLFAEVTGVAQVGLDDNFFELGGHSLLGTRLVSLVRATLDCELPLRTLFESPTVAQLSFRLREARQRRLPLQPQARPARLPLSYAQQRLWFLDQLEGATPEYNMPQALRLRGPLSPAALEQAINLIVARHESLRTHFTALDGEPIQLIAASLTVTLPREDLSELDEDTQQTRVRAALAHEAEQPFDLAQGPVFRVKLLKLAEEEHVLLRTMHHIVSDGWSEEVFSRELVTLYEAVRAGAPDPLPPLTIQYADFALWQRQWLEAEVLNEGLAYWKQQLADLPQRLELPSDRPRPALQTFKAEAYQTRLSAKQTAALKQLSRSQQTTLYMTLLAGFTLLLQRYSGQEDIVVGSPIANRQEAQLEELIGFFVNMLCLRVHVEGSQTFAELLAEVRRTALAAYEHQDVPFERLVEELSPQRSLNTTPLFQVAFALQNAPRVTEGVKDLTVETVISEELRVRYDLEVHVFEEGEELSFTWLYNRDLFDEWRIEQMAHHYLRLLEAVITNTEQRVGDIELLATGERHLILEQWNDTAFDLAPATLPQLFEAQVRETPGAIAVVSHGQHLSYAGLNEHANRLAHLLITRGVGPENVVGLALPGSLEMIVSVLGILKAGAAYLPIDTDYPAARVGFMLEDAEPACVIANGKTLKHLPGACHPLILDDPETIRALAGSASHDPDDAERITALNPNNPAYVIYTSGSTGTPKGVVVTHPSVNGLIDEFQRRGPLSQGSRCSLWTSSSFDVSVYELFSALLNGDTLCIPDEDDRLIPDVFLRWLMTESINSAHIPVFMLPALAQSADHDKIHLERLSVGSEPISAALLQSVRDMHPKLHIINGYGPTETTICSALYKFSHADQTVGNGVVPIGTPIQNTRLYVLDSNLNPVPVGVAGELFIGGAGLARGYLKQPALTAQRFVVDAYGDAGARMYRTGDRVRWRVDGNLEFLGRVDEQIKLRGFRIEPGEIEATLRQHPSVREAVVLVRQDQPDEKRLVAYVVPQPPDPGQQAEMHEQTEQVEQWQALFDDLQTRTRPDFDPRFNLIGWDSSYTGEPIPVAQMQQWLDSTVARILALQPQHVLEIGCGTGLLLFRIAPHCRRYWGTDFSAATLAQLQQYVSTGEAQLPQVKLLPRTADNFAGFKGEAFDTVILNSVSQYFPSVDYLERVLRGAIAALRDGGAIFVGDVRSLPLLPAFHATLVLSSAEARWSKTEFSQQLQKQLLREKELVLDPAFFTALAQQETRISRVEVQLKQGRKHNELNQFRYDVVLHVGTDAGTDVNTPIEWLDWEQNELSLVRLKALLEDREPLNLGVSRVPNARLRFANQILAWLNSEQGPEETVAELRQQLAEPSPCDADPDQVWTLTNDLPYDVAVSWSEADNEGRFDVVFTRHGLKPTNYLKPPARTRPPSAYANNPLQANFTRQVVVGLRQYLKERLPEYMVPSAFVVLESLPLTTSRKIDRRALPPPEATRPELEKAYVAPRNPVEEVLAELWANVLGLDRVGIFDNFFDLGGHSLLATQLISRARDLFQCELPLRWIFDASTVAAFSQALTANEPRPGQTTKIASAFKRVKAMRLKSVS